MTDKIRDLEPGEVPSDTGTYRFPSGVVVRVTTEPDPFVSLNDFDYLGRTERYSHKYGEDAPRPDDMNGAARKLHLRDSWIWWQPPSDVNEQQQPEIFLAILRAATDAIEYGFRTVVGEVLDGVDYWGRPIVVDGYLLGGLEPFDDIAPALRDILGELSERGHQTI